MKRFLKIGFVSLFILGLSIVMSGCVWTDNYGKVNFINESTMSNPCYPISIDSLAAGETSYREKWKADEDEDYTGIPTVYIAAGTYSFDIEVSYIKGTGFLGTKRSINTLTVENVVVNAGQTVNVYYNKDKAWLEGAE